MIKFDKLFDEVMPANGITIYTLYAKLNVARSQIYRFKSSRLQLESVNALLQLLYEYTGKVYQLSDICEFVPDPPNENGKDKKKEEE